MKPCWLERKVNGVVGVATTATANRIQAAARHGSDPAARTIVAGTNQESRNAGKSRGGSACPQADGSGPNSTRWGQRVPPSCLPGFLIQNLARVPRIEKLAYNSGPRFRSGHSANPHPHPLPCEGRGDPSSHVCCRSAGRAESACTWHRQNAGNRVRPIAVRRILSVFCISSALVVVGHRHQVTSFHIFRANRSNRARSQRLATANAVTFSKSNSLTARFTAISISHFRCIAT